MNNELEVLKEAIQRLELAGLDYMLTGSMAKIFYSTPRMTRDIDIVIHIKPEEIEKLVTTFHPDYYVDRESIVEAVQKKTMFNILHNEKLVKIDFVIKKDAIFRDTEFQRRKRVEIAGIAAWIVSQEDLILSKLDWAKESYSELQLGDVADLLKNSDSLDMKYIENWVEKLLLQDIFAEAKKKLRATK